MRKLEDKQIHPKGRQDASAWSSEMKEETNHCLILYRHLILPDLSSKMRPCGGKRCTEEEEEALLYFIIIYNLASTHYPIQPLSFSFPNFMVAHGVGVAQAKPACKHTIATRKCYQYNTMSMNCAFSTIMSNLGVTLCRPLARNGNLFKNAVIQKKCSYIQNYYSYTFFAVFRLT